VNDRVITTRAPLRISFGGGGSDLPSYYREHGGFVVSAAIDRHVCMLATTAFQERFRLKHTGWEEVDDVAAVEHPILRAALEHHWDGRPLELASVADVPPGTGLGSSGAYAVCLLRTLELAAGLPACPPAELAERACELEIGILGRTVGKQDQYVAAHGGLCAYTFHPDDTVTVEPLAVPEAVAEAIRERFLLFYTGRTRSAETLFAQQVKGDPEVVRAVHRAKELAIEMRAALEAGDLARCADLMNEQWEAKRARSPDAITEPIAALREQALAAGARGATLMGAGGGGFLLVYADDPEALRAAMDAPELRFGLEPAGCRAHA
jgi:D-glycero-alpha-D-manno-heptose-7-phosphate kinase